MASLVAVVAACTPPQAAAPPSRVSQARPYHTHLIIGPLTPLATMRPIRTPPVWLLAATYLPRTERLLVEMANRGQWLRDYPLLSISSTLRSLAREQSKRMADRGEATLTADDLATMKASVSPSSLPPRDWWVFVNKVTSATDAGLANAIVEGGTRPWKADNFYALKSTFNGIGVGVYRTGDTYYATAIVMDHFAP